MVCLAAGLLSFRIKNRKFYSTTQLPRALPSVDSVRVVATGCPRKSRKRPNCSFGLRGPELVSGQCVTPAKALQNMRHLFVGELYRTAWLGTFSKLCFLVPVGAIETARLLLQEATASLGG